MRELLLLRHAKSAWDQPEQGDHARDLAPRGVAAAGRIGQEIRALGLVPDLVLCSTATRTRRTLALVETALGQKLAVRFEEALYLASAIRLRTLIRGVDASVAPLMLVGHDPGLHQLAVELAAEGEAADMASLRAKFPTGALARIQLPIDSWADLGTPGTLVSFLRPRDLG